jgi:hypothetical protein
VIVMQQADAPPPPAPAPSALTAGPSEQPLNILTSGRANSAVKRDGEIVVCARRSSDQFRLRPLPPPPASNGLLSLPLRVQIAPGVSVGIQRGRGFCVKAEFGPGKKTGDPER